MAPSKGVRPRTSYINCLCRAPLKPACSRRCRRSWSKSTVWSPGLLSWRFRRQAQGIPPECFQPLWKEPLRGPLSCLAKELKPSWIRSRSSNSLFWRAGARKMGDVGSASSAIQPKTNASILGASAKARPAPMTLLGAAPEGGEEDEDVPGAGADDGEASALARVLVQQTQILNQLSKKSSDPLQSLLGGGGGGDDEAKIPGVRGMAARQLLREQFAAHPERVVAKVRERLALARRKGSVAELEPRDMYLHFQETVPLGTFKTLTYFSFLMAEMWEAAERNQGAELMSLLALGLVFAEQVANEQGHTRLGWLLTGRPDPPFSIVEQRRAPRPELPHGMLADPRWVTAQLAYLRDADLISERTTKVHLNLTPQGGQQGQDDGTKGPGRGRGRKGKRTDQTGETTA